MTPYKQLGIYIKIHFTTYNSPTLSDAKNIYMSYLAGSLRYLSKSYLLEPPGDKCKLWKVKYPVYPVPMSTLRSTLTLTFGFRRGVLHINPLILLSKRFFDWGGAIAYRLRQIKARESIGREQIKYNRISSEKKIQKKKTFRNNIDFEKFFR